MHQRQHVHLMSDIQRGGRFIQQQATAILRHQHRDPRALTFTAGKTVDQTVCQRFESHQRNGFFHFLTVSYAKTP
jgi:hypothetical protein